MFVWMGNSADPHQARPVNLCCCLQDPASVSVSAEQNGQEQMQNGQALHSSSPGSRAHPESCWGCPPALYPPLGKDGGFHDPIRHAVTKCIAEVASYRRAQCLQIMDQALSEDPLNGHSAAAVDEEKEEKQNHRPSNCRTINQSRRDQIARFHTSHPSPSSTVVILNDLVQ